MDDAIANGTVLRDGRYVVVGVLGTGSQGSTLEAIDKKEGRPVAIKRFDVRHAKSWKEVELAEREARVLAELRHPGLPRYVEHFEHEGALFLVMERIEGASLAARRGSRERLSVTDVERMMHQVGEVLAYLHERAPPVIHRDIKPGNVIRRPDGSFAIVDFGAVRDKLRPDGGSTVVGTFGYMAPEQFQGRASAKTDVYALGATALALLTGLEPEALPHKGLAIDVHEALRGLTVSPALRDALIRMLTPDPDVRAASVRAAFALPEGTKRSVPPAQQKEREPTQSRKERRKQEKRRRKEARQSLRPQRRRRIPFIAWPFVSIAFLVARVVVVATTKLAVPVLLHALAYVLGRNLRRIAEEVSHGGDEALHRITEADERLRGVEREPIRVRVADEDVIDAEAIEEEEDATPTRSRRQR